MNRFVKAFLCVMAVIGLVIVSLFVVAKFLITPERVRETVLPIAEKTLNRPVSIGDIDIRLFSGISIKNFKVGSKDEKADFISADALNLTYRIWPLFRLRVVVDEARLDGPTIRAVRFENGKFNFSDLLASETPTDGGKTENRPPPEQTGAEPVIDVLINKLSITNGSLLFTDRYISRTPVRHHLENLRVSATGISPDGAFPISLETRINGAPLAISGTVDPAKLWADLRLRLEGFDVSGIMPYLENRFPGTLTAMRLDLNFSVTGDPEAVKTSGQVKATQADLVLDALPDAPLNHAEAGLEYELSIDTKLEELTIGKANARLNGIPLSLNGTIAHYGSQPIVDLYAALPVTPLASIVAAVPEKLVEPVAEMEPGGQLGADVHLSGDPGNMKTLLRKGQITCDAIRFTTGGLPVRLNGRIDMKNDSVRADGFAVRIADSPAALDFTATNVLGKPIRISHTLIAPKMNLDEILSAGGNGQKSPPPKPGDEKAPPPPRPIGPVDLPLTVDGTVRVGAAVYRGLDLNHFELRYRLENNVLTVDQIRGDVAGGTISGTGRADLNQKDISYTADMSIAGTQTDPIVSALYPPAAKTLFGNLFLKLNMNGQGLALDQIRQSLTGNADMRVADGRLTGTGLTSGLSAFLDTKKLEVLHFNSISGDVRLVNGKFRIDSEYAGNDMRMAPTGTIGLDGSIALSLNMRVAPELAAGIDGNEIVSKLLKTQEGWAVIPVNVAGSLFAPRFSLDTAVVKQMLQEKAINTLQQQIREKLLKPDANKQDSAPDQQPDNLKSTDKPGAKKQPSVEQMLQEGLEKLMK